MDCRSRIGLTAFFGLLTAFSGPGVQTASAQYFGRNQVQYESFDF